jgi:hypothetical protein
MTDTVWSSSEPSEFRPNVQKIEHPTIIEAIKVLDEVKELLKTKNTAYGDSALSPIRIFSKLKASDSIAVRIDDKLSRIRNVGVDDNTEDSVMDLLGYLTLLVVAIKKEKRG